MPMQMASRIMMMAPTPARSRTFSKTVRIAARLTLPRRSAAVQPECKEGMSQKLVNAQHATNMIKRFSGCIAQIPLVQSL